MILDVTPTIPAPLSRLPDFAGNLFFSWHRPTRALFEALDPQLWAQSRGNPKRLLRTVDQGRLNAAAIELGSRLVGAESENGPYVDSGGR